MKRMTDRWRLARSAIPFGCLTAFFGVASAVQVESKQTMTFTAAQAEEGHGLYAKNCAMCHGAELQGGAGLPLSGSAFIARWNNRPLPDLTQVISEQMPLTAPHSLSSTEYLSIVSYILLKNGFSSGDTPLTRATSNFGTLAFTAPTANAEKPKTAGPLPVLPASPRYYGEASTGVPSQAELESDRDDWLMYNRDYK
jgi:mono/diheme cytochrome c family protein